ncbi:MAG TPA: hypothetical protein P5098_00365 [Candidatus Dojkabacteria bacterium]|nr:hypothetical protein [Candidatus Dojkabacteria bacterium]
MKNLNKKKREVLLLEPNYHNKYPPIGLMKIAFYHRKLGDRVTFYKGDMKKFILDQTSIECINKLQKIDDSINWLREKKGISDHICFGKKTLLETDYIVESKNRPLIKDCLDYYRTYYIQGKYKQTPKWDRVCITSLFTFYWNITIKTIEFAKYLVKDLNELKIGGIMASLLPREIEKATGIKPFKGLLDKPFILDPNINLIIDDLPLDYSILEEIDYEYLNINAYYTHMTRGCVNKCGFCAVPKIEPIFKEKIPTLVKFNYSKKVYGDQQNLILMDNNILASPRYLDIIKDIKKMGFTTGAAYIEPNQLKISIENLKKGLNDKAYIRKSYKLIHKIRSRLQGKAAQDFYNALDKYSLMSSETTTKENLIACYPEIKDTYERMRSKTPVKRCVDFNQGTDCRFVTEEKMKLLSEIPINPLRIAFDNIKMKEQYIKAIALAAQYGIMRLSNYILYNYKDSPEDLYERLKINIDLCEKFNLHIYSFPMKYIPIYGEEAKNREYIGPKWNKKFLGAVQAILNVNKGIVVPPNNNDSKGRSFFEKAFGKNLTEFRELLYMPEPYIIYRKICEEKLDYTNNWRDMFKNIKPSEKNKIISIIENEEFKKSFPGIRNKKILELLNHYNVTRDDILKES